MADRKLVDDTNPSIVRTPRGCGYVYDSLTFDWVRAPVSQLLLLFASYSLIIDRATTVPMFVSGAQ